MPLRRLRVCRFVTLAAWCALASFVAHAAETSAPLADAELGQPAVQAFTSRDYDADPQIWAIATDARGLVYLGNKGCVLEYDGAAWRRIPIGNTIYVRAVALAPDGRVYVGGVDELGYLQEDA